MPRKVTIHENKDDSEFLDEYVFEHSPHIFTDITDEACFSDEIYTSNIPSVRGHYSFTGWSGRLLKED